MCASVLGNSIPFHVVMVLANIYIHFLYLFRNSKRMFKLAFDCCWCFNFCV